MSDSSSKEHREAQRRWHRRSWYVLGLAAVLTIFVATTGLLIDPIPIPVLAIGLALFPIVVVAFYCLRKSHTHEQQADDLEITSLLSAARRRDFDD